MGTLYVATPMEGRKFGRLLVVSREGTSIDGRATWKCICHCGKEVVVIGRNLRRGITSSCGCYQTEVNSKVHKKHGMHGTKTYKTWTGILNRCRNKHKDYGGRGIVVCKRWDKFENFYADMGDSPEGLTIERINNNSGYFPDNCRWATPLEQGKNKRNNIVIEYMGNKLILSEWARKLGIRYSILHNRLSNGLPIEKVLTI